MVNRILRELHKKTDRLISKGYWAIVSVSDAKTPFAYTIGLHSQNLPELIIVALPPEISHRILNTAGLAATNASPFMHGDIIEKLSSHPLTIIDVINNEEHATQVYAHYGTWDFKLQQLVVPDPKGRFHWDEDCDKIMPTLQPLLGNPPYKKMH